MVRLQYFTKRRLKIWSKKCFEILHFCLSRSSRIEESSKSKSIVQNAKKSFFPSLINYPILTEGMKIMYCQATKMTKNWLNHSATIRSTRMQLPGQLFQLTRLVQDNILHLEYFDIEYKIPATQDFQTKIHFLVSQRHQNLE